MSTAVLPPLSVGFSSPPVAQVACAAASKALLSVNLSAGYKDAATLRDLSFDLQQGERLGVVGSSGAGKSTLAMSLMGLQAWRGGWSSGSIMLEGTDLLRLSEREWRGTRGKRVALVPQSPGTALNPCLSLRAHFEEAWRAHAPRNKAQLEARVQTLLQRVDIPSTDAFLKRRPAQVSIGQAQRVLVALALLHQPALLIADEPTSALDVCNQEELLRLLHDLSREYRMTLLYISHDLVSVVRMCDRMLVLSEGTAVQTLRCDQLTTGAEYHPATRRLLQTLPAPPEVLRRHVL